MFSLKKAVLATALIIVTIVILAIEQDDHKGLNQETRKASAQSIVKPAPEIGDTATVRKGQVSRKNPVDTPVNLLRAEEACEKHFIENLAMLDQHQDLVRPGEFKDCTFHREINEYLECNEQSTQCDALRSRLLLSRVKKIIEKNFSYVDTVPKMILSDIFVSLVNKGENATVEDLKISLELLRGLEKKTEQTDPTVHSLLQLMVVYDLAKKGEDVRNYNWDERIQSIRRSENMGSIKRTLNIELSYYLTTKGDIDGAFRAVERFSEMFPNEPYGVYKLAEVLYYSNQILGAKKQLAKCKAIVEETHDCYETDQLISEPVVQDRLAADYPFFDESGGALSIW